MSERGTSLELVDGISPSDKTFTVLFPDICVRAGVLADQYRKKSTLFKTNVVLVPLGDDFRWDTSKEINAQFTNYFKLIDYINTHPDMRMEVRDGWEHMCCQSGVVTTCVYCCCCCCCCCC